MEGLGEREVASSGLVEQPAEDEVSRVALENISRRRQRLSDAKTAVLDLLEEREETGGHVVDLRKAVFEQRGVRSEFSGAALRELEQDGLIEMAPDFSYHVAITEELPA
jgi:hypothetical protein